MTVGTRVSTICTVDDNGTTFALGTIGEVIKDHCGDIMYRIDYDEGGYDFMYQFEFSKINHIVKGVE